MNLMSRCSARTALLIGLAGALPSALATDLTDTPLPVASSVAPNIMFMIDTSGSMKNIVPDAPYDASATYLASCPKDNIFKNDASTTTYYDNAVSEVDGSVTVGGKIFGTGNGQRCFDPDKLYNARLLSPASSTPAKYTGKYLNWYFCALNSAGKCDGAANFGAGATRKPGTRTRLEITKVAAKGIIDSLDSVRAALSSYNTNSTKLGQGGELAVEMGLNDGFQKAAIKKAIDGLTASGATPLAETLSGIGGYFAQVPAGTTAKSLTLHPGNAASGLDPASMQRSTATAANVFAEEGAALLIGGKTPSKAPIEFSCQKNFAVLMTDGRPNEDVKLSTHLANYIGVHGACTGEHGRKCAIPAANAGYHVFGANRQKHLGATHNYEKEGSDYLDDVAAALYDIDLRPDLEKKNGAKNNVLSYTIGFSDIDTINDPLMQEAAAAGGGLFFSAANTAELVSAFQRAADDILAKDGSSAAVAVANAHVTSSDNASYATSYNSGNWTGDLIASPINEKTGLPDVNNPIWKTGCPNPDAYIDSNDSKKGVLGCSAQVQLDARTEARKIFTSADSCLVNCGIPFQAASAAGDTGVLSDAQLKLLATPGKTDGAAVLDYLRGVRTGETSLTYRTRAHLLGDMVNAEPLVVRPPERNYLDEGYEPFKKAKEKRAVIVVQPANDGMVHAFEADSGAEAWAYVPNILISDSKDPNNANTSLLNTRTRAANFNHYFLIDATAVLGDVDFNNAAKKGTKTSAWRSIVVGGMGKGGRGYYALDVSSTSAAKEADAAEKALWEFPRSISNATARAAAIKNMGYSFGKPIIVKTEAEGWVVLISSGYNNGADTGGDGLGHLYVVNPKTGDLIADLVTGKCNGDAEAEPCGLAHFNAYIEDKDKDNTAELAYGGDLFGNVWRFDLRGKTVADWKVSKLATLRSGAKDSDPVQPVTSVPELGRLYLPGGDKYMVYVGTGIYLGKTDLPCPPEPATCLWKTNNQTQTMYGLVDARDGGTLPDPLLGSLVQQTYTTTGNNRTFTSKAVDLSETVKGWYINFTDGERIVNDPALASGAIVFTSTKPSSVPCVPGGTGWLYALDYSTGGQVAGATRGGVYIDEPPTRPVPVQLPDGSIQAIIRKGGGTTIVEEVPRPPGVAAGRRVSWRELIDN